MQPGPARIDLDPRVGAGADEAGLPIDAGDGDIDADDHMAEQSASNHLKTLLHPDVLEHRTRLRSDARIVRIEDRSLLAFGVARA